MSEQQKFPLHNFPDWWNIHDCRANHLASLSRTHKLYGQGRSMVCDWGRLGAYNPFTQQTQFPSNNSSTILIDSSPFPLLSTGNIISRDNSYLSYGSIAKSRSLLQEVSGVLKVNNKTGRFSILARKKDRISRVNKSLSLNASMEVVSQKMKLLPPRLADMIMNNPHCLQSDFINSCLNVKVNSLYSGSCLSVKNNKNIVNYLSGPNMQTVCLRQLNSDCDFDNEINDLPFLSSSPLREFHHNEDVLQINEDHNHLLIRHEQSLTIHLNAAKKSFQTKTIAFNKHVLYSAAFSPHDQDEIIYSHADGFVLYSISKEKILFQHEIANCTSNVDTWTQATVASHRNSILYSDRSRVCLFDTRRKPESARYGPDIDLFTLPVHYLNESERIQYVYGLPQPGNTIQGYYTLAYTNFNRLLLDYRMPKRAVLQSTMPLRYPVQMVHASNYEEDEIYLMESSQMANEICVFSLKHGHSISKLPFVLKSFDKMISTSATLIANRLNDSFCLGISILPLKQSTADNQQYLCLRLNHFGDLFGQIVGNKSSASSIAAFNLDSVEERCNQWKNSIFSMEIKETVENPDDIVMEDWSQFLQSAMSDDDDDSAESVVQHDFYQTFLNSCQIGPLVEMTTCLKEEEDLDCVNTRYGDSARFILATLDDAKDLVKDPQAQGQRRVEKENQLDFIDRCYRLSLVKRSKIEDDVESVMTVASMVNTLFNNDIDLTTKPPDAPATETETLSENDTLSDIFSD